MRSGFKSKNYFGIASQHGFEDSRLRCVAALERLYLVAALALLMPPRRECLCKSLALLLWLTALAARH